MIELFHDYILDAEQIAVTICFLLSILWFKSFTKDLKYLALHIFLATLIEFGGSYLSRNGINNLFFFTST